MNVLISGLKNYVGERSVSLMGGDSFHVFALTSNVTLFKRRFSGQVNAELYEADLIKNVFDFNIELPDLDVAYYFVQVPTLGDGLNVKMELLSLRNFIKYFKKFNCSRLVYVANMSDKSCIQSFVNLFAELAIDYTVVLSSQVIGRGSALERTYTHLYSRKIVLQSRKYASKLLQPLAVGDLISWLKGLLDVPAFSCRVLEVGGVEKISLKNLFELYQELQLSTSKPVFFNVPQAVARWFYRSLAARHVIDQVGLCALLRFDDELDEVWREYMRFNFMGVREALLSDQ